MNRPTGNQQTLHPHGRGRNRSRSFSPLRRALLCILIAVMLPLHALAQPAEARGIGGEISKVIPFAGVVVGWRHRNRVYRDSNRFIRDRNQYYDGLRETARKQLVNREIRGLRPSQVAAYVKVVGLIEQERTVVHDVAESRKRQARSEFHNRLEDAVFFAISGSRLAQQVYSALRNGIGSAQQVLDRALNTLTSGGSGSLQDIQRIRKIAGHVSMIAGVVGGKVGNRLRNASDRIIQAIDLPQQAAQAILGKIQRELEKLNLTLDMLSQVGRMPSAGALKEHLMSRFLPGDGEESGDISLEAISAVLSQIEVGDGSLRDEARQALRQGFVARCAAIAEAYKEQLNALQKSGSEPPGAEELTAPCLALKPGDLKKKAETPNSSTQPEAVATEEEEKEIPPKFYASGQFPEVLSGTVDSSKPLGTAFTLVADYATGTISGELNGGRTTSGNPIRCVDTEDPSIVYDTAYVDYIDAYNAKFSGTIDLESGDFSLTIKAKGSTSDRKTQPYTDERCVHLNSELAPGSIGWTGEGTISGYVTRDGSIELTTRWTSFGGNISVTGTWYGVGTVENPE